MSTCSSCHSLHKTLLRRRISHFQSVRRVSSSTIAWSKAPSSQNPRSTDPPYSYSCYWDTFPPSAENLDRANHFFRTHRPSRLWTNTEWRTQNDSSPGSLIPEVAFLGRSNTGKSSLLNRVLMTPDLNRVGKKPGKTTMMHAWGLAAVNPLTGGALKGTGGDKSVKVAVLDLPGYGHASRSEWGREVGTYLKRRKQLKRVFLLIDAMHGVMPNDRTIIDVLRSEGIPYQIIASKCDRLSKGGRLDSQVQKALEAIRAQLSQQDGGPASALLCLGEMLAVGSIGMERPPKSVDESTCRKGVADIRWAILRATGLDEHVMAKDHLVAKLRALVPEKSDPAAANGVPAVRSYPIHVPQHTDLSPLDPSYNTNTSSPTNTLSTAQSAALFPSLASSSGTVDRPFSAPTSHPVRRSPLPRSSSHSPASSFPPPPTRDKLTDILAAAQIALADTLRHGKGRPSQQQQQENPRPTPQSNSSPSKHGREQPTPRATDAQPPRGGRRSSRSGEGRAKRALSSGRWGRKGDSGDKKQQQQQTGLKQLEALASNVISV